MRLFIVLIIVCFSLKACVLVQGGYLVQVRLNGYSNPTGKCGHSENCRTSQQAGQFYCCDSNSLDTEDCDDNRCDSYFTYCLRPFGEVQLTTSRCSTNQVTSHSNRGDGPLDFSQSKVLGIDNPQNLSGFEHAYYRVQLYIEVGDKDPGSDEVVDILLVNLNLTVAESQRQNHTGFYNLVTMDLTIIVLCEGNFGGSDCTQCVPGFTGTNCDRRTPCFGVNCSGRGYCENNMDSFTCMCNNGYKGRLCESIDCSANNCNGNGVCMDDISPPSCNCNPDFTGRVCEISIDDCSPNPCDERGQCVDGVNSFQCICDPGFTGKLCQTNINDCVGVNCSGNVDGSSGSKSSTGDGGSNVGAIAGGVIGALLAVLILLIIIIVLFVIILKCQPKSLFKLREANFQGNGNSGPMPGDNPVYEPGYTVTTAVTTFPEREGSDSSVEERKFDNPMYGDQGETDDSVHTVPFDQQDQQSLPNHEFDNPIYGTETYDN